MNGSQYPDPQASPRTQLVQEFIALLAEHFSLYGADAIARLCENKPQDYLRLVAAVLPKETAAKFRAHLRPPFEAMDHAALRQSLVASLRILAGAGIDLHELVRDALGGRGDTQPPPLLPPLH